jgi:recombination protein RecT
MSTAKPKDNGLAVFQRTLESALDKSKERMASVLPSYLTPERMIQLAKTAVFRTPKLTQCDPMSIVAAVIEASEIGLEIGGQKQEGFLCPTWNSKASRLECQFRPGYRGLQKLAMNTGELKSCHAYTVGENDFFDYQLGVDVQIIHRPNLENPGETIAAYCAGRLASGEPYAEVMNRADIQAIRARSQTPEAGPWVTDWREMARKTVLRRKLKTLPWSSEKLARAIELDDRDYDLGEAGARPVLAMPRRLSEVPRELPPAPETLTIPSEATQPETVPVEAPTEAQNAATFALSNEPVPSDLRKKVEDLANRLTEFMAQTELDDVIETASGVRALAHVQEGDLAKVYAKLETEKKRRRSKR